MTDPAVRAPLPARGPVADVTLGEADGVPFAAWGSIRVTGRGALVGAIARRIAAERPDVVAMRCWRGPVLCFDVVPVRVWAGLAVREGDGSARFIRWRPHPGEAARLSAEDRRDAAPGAETPCEQVARPNAPRAPAEAMPERTAP